jgi:hypothetical protein
LLKKLRSRAPTDPPVAYAALGSDNRYFVRFADGEWQAVCSASLSNELNNSAVGVEMIAFGNHWNSYYIKYQDGSTYWQDMPTGLHQKLISLSPQDPAVEQIYISNSESSECIDEDAPWFLRFDDGSWEARGLSNAMDARLNLIRAQNLDVTDIIFGHQGAWLIRTAQSVDDGEADSDTKTESSRNTQTLTDSDSEKKKRKKVQSKTKRQSDSKETNAASAVTATDAPVPATTTGTPSPSDISISAPMM